MFTPLAKALAPVRHYTQRVDGQPCKPLIRFRGVDHFYGDGSLRRQILYDISAEVRAVEIVLLTGPSGSGKTTLLTLAGSLRRVLKGSNRILRSASRPDKEHMPG